MQYLWATTTSHVVKALKLNVAWHYLFDERCNTSTPTWSHSQNSVAAAAAAAEAFILNKKHSCTTTISQGCLVKAQQMPLF